MARIDFEGLKRINKERNTVQARVNTSFCTFDQDGEKYIQFDMYGRSERKNPEKPSQVLQLNQTDAERLIHLLLQEFSL